MTALPPAVATIWSALGVDADAIAARGLPVWDEADRLAWAGLGPDGRDKFLVPSAARAWQRMVAAAGRDGIELQLVSAFRSLAYQQRLVQRKLDAGIALGDALRVLAPPGCSEHHSGRAVDVGTPGSPAAEEAFETTDAFRWLQTEAARFRFVMSFPRDNRYGYIYEPWHWCWQANPR